VPGGTATSSRPYRTIMAPADGRTTSITSGATLLSALVEYLSLETPLRPACSCTAWNTKFLRLLVSSGR
jgi:hypothetical protein